MGRFLSGFGAAVLVAGAAWFFAGASPTESQAPPRLVQWEYKVYHHGPPRREDQEFDKLGADGWELVSSTYMLGGVSSHSFKRPKR